MPESEIWKKCGKRHGERMTEGTKVVGIDPWPYFLDGFVPCKKRTGKYQYIYLRWGQEYISLGKFTRDKWKWLRNEYMEYRDVFGKADRPMRESKKRSTSRKSRSIASIVANPFSGSGKEIAEIIDEVEDEEFKKLRVKYAKIRLQRKILQEEQKIERLRKGNSEDVCENSNGNPDLLIFIQLLSEKLLEENKRLREENEKLKSEISEVDVEKEAILHKASQYADEVGKYKKENDQLRAEIDRLNRKVAELLNESHNHSIATNNEAVVHLLKIWESMENKDVTIAKQEMTIRILENMNRIMKNECEKLFILLITPENKRGAMIRFLSGN